MVNTVIASLALFATSVSALGSAVVVNQCPYQVFVYGVPAADGGFEETTDVMQTGDSWSQQWTELTNSHGWSIKLAKDTSLANIMQYEYTYQSSNPNIIWYDLSAVNGNPWDGDWEIQADGHNCAPKYAYYRFATDDAFGMQSCDSAATITVTLCSGSGTNSSSPAPSSAAPAPSAPPATTVSVPAFTPPAVSVTVVNAPAVSTQTPSASTQAPATSAAPAVAWSGPWTHWGIGANGAVVAENVAKRGAAARVQTTLATLVSNAPASTDVAERLARRHEHGILRHRHHQHA